MATVLERMQPAVVGDATDVVLRLPHGFRYQLVFRRESPSPLACPDMDGLQFIFCDSVWGYAKQLQKVIGVEGAKAAARGMAKLLSKSRIFYFMTDGRQILHHGWITASICKHYWIEKNAAVIGPIWTSDAARGRGIATTATTLAMNEMLQRGFSILYIDTSTTNTSCLRVISKCGFGPPIACYMRGDEGRRTYLT